MATAESNSGMSNYDSGVHDQQSTWCDRLLAAEGLYREVSRLRMRSVWTNDRLDGSFLIFTSDNANESHHRYRIDNRAN